MVELVNVPAGLGAGFEKRCRWGETGGEGWNRQHVPGAWLMVKRIVHVHDQDVCTARACLTLLLLDGRCLAHTRHWEYRGEGEASTRLPAPHPYLHRLNCLGRDPAASKRA